MNNSLDVMMRYLRLHFSLIRGTYGADNIDVPEDFSKRKYSESNFSLIVPRTGRMDDAKRDYSHRKV